MTKKQVRSLKKGVKSGVRQASLEKPAADKKAAVAQSAVQEKGGESVPARFVQFLKDVRVEFDKVAWAGRKETMTLTVTTMALTFFIASYLGLVDIVLSKIVGFLIK